MSKARLFYLGSEVTCFVMFIVGRVGSNFLTSSMNAHPNVLGLNETLMDMTAEQQRQWTLRFLTPPLIGRKGAIGFKIKPVQLADPAGYAQLLREKKPRIIHIWRRNRIKSVISHLNGKRLEKATGMWNLYDESRRLPPFEVDFAEFEEALRNRERTDRESADYVSSLGLPTLSITYEEMLQDINAVLARTFEFLNVPPLPVKPSTFKATSDDLREVITNFDALRARYAGAEYEAMFDEVIAAPSASRAGALARG